VSCRVSVYLAGITDLCRVSVYLTGIQLSRRVMSSIVRRYGGKERRLSFTDFVLTTCRVSAMYRESALHVALHPSVEPRFYASWHRCSEYLNIV